MSRLLYISVSHQFSRIHLASQKVKSDDSPLPFYTFLRKNCDGGVIRDIRQAGDDRIVEIAIEKRTDTATKVGEEGSRAIEKITLIAELFGRTSNLLCTDEQRTILESLHHVSGADRAIKPRETYIPPTINKAKAGKACSESSERASRNRFESALRPDRKLSDKSSNETQTDDSDLGSLSFLIERHYLQAERKAHALRLSGEIATSLRRAKKDAARRIENIQKALQEAAKAHELRIKGELLKTNMNGIKPGMKSITVANYFDPDQKDVDIELDASLSPKDNLERYFKRYKKLTAAREGVEKRLHEARAVLDRIQELEIRLSDLSASAPQPETNGADLSKTAVNRLRPQRMEVWLDEHKELCDEIARAGLLKVKQKAPSKRRDKKTPASAPRRFISAAGAHILVGRNNQQNDELTIRLARGNDLWLHVQQVPGSHVIVRAQKGKSVPLETLLDAANLAVFFSKARNASKPLVDYTQCKYVRKPKGAKPGVVTFSQNKTLAITPDRDRLARLFAMTEDP